MAAVETPQSRATIGLLIVLTIAKALMLVGRPVPLSIWTAFVYTWQDVLVALIFGAIAYALRRAPLVWGAYAVMTIYIAINVAIARELSSTLTVAMLRGAGRAIADSISQRATLANLASISVVLIAGGLAPMLLDRLRPRFGVVMLTFAIAWITVGAAATPRVETLGRHRNAVTTLLPPARPSAAGERTGASDWRASPFEVSPLPDLTKYRGMARDQNVILISLESTAAQYLKMYGATSDPTPHLSRLAAKGFVVDDAYAVYPESIKGLFSTLCSRFPAYDTEVETLAATPCVSLAQRLKDRGYRTALFHSGRFAYLGMPSVIEGRGFDVLEDAGAIGGQIDSSFGIDEPSTVRRMLRWIDSVGAEKHFFLTYLPIAGHHPYATSSPGPFDSGTELGQYLNALHEGDAALGEFFDGLAARHLDRDTLIVLFGDHGEAFQQHDGNVAHTQFIYDENVRVPLIFVPGSSGSTASSGSRVHRVASLIDVTPTILDLLGLPIPAEHQGASVFDSQPRMALFFTDYALGWLGLRDSCWKYQFQIDAARSSLFDVCVDPAEKMNRADEQPARVRAYRERVEQWSHAQQIKGSR